MSLGFIRGPLEVRLLMLYILARVVYPIQSAQLLDLALCDDGVDYFQFTEALSSLKSTGHIQEDSDQCLSITAKGKANGAICEDEIAYSVRKKCDQNIAELNRKLQRQHQVRSVLLPCEGGVTVRMILDDDTGNLMTLDMLAPDETQGKVLADSFQRQAEKLYDTMLSLLLEKPKE